MFIIKYFNINIKNLYCEYRSIPCIHYYNVKLLYDRTTDNGFGFQLKSLKICLNHQYADIFKYHIGRH